MYGAAKDATHKELSPIVCQALVNVITPYVQGVKVIPDSDNDDNADVRFRTEFENVLGGHVVDALFPTLAGHRERLTGTGLAVREACGVAALEHKWDQRVRRAVVHGLVARVLSQHLVVVEDMDGSLDWVVCCGWLVGWAVSYTHLTLPTKRIV